MTISSLIQINRIKSNKQNSQSFIKMGYIYKREFKWNCEVVMKFNETCLFKLVSWWCHRLLNPPFCKLNHIVLHQVIIQSNHIIIFPIFQLDIVPSKMKIGKIIPVYKKGDKHLFSNYRPITLLPCFSKILEKVVYNRIINHLNQNNLLSCSHNGFRAGHSCEHALIDLQEVLLDNISHNRHSIGIFLDLSKAFDVLFFLP